MKWFAVLLAAVTLSAAGLSASAQPASPAPAAQPQQNEAWYASQLAELSNVLGGAHYLRLLCQGRGDQRWRDYMLGVIAREPNYRTQLTEAFNNGYREQEARFESCDEEASRTEADLRSRGFHIADGLRARHASE